MIKILLSILGLGYLVSPYDLLPDFAVGIGWIDDLFLLFVLWRIYQVFKKRRYGYEKFSNGSHQSSDRTQHNNNSGKDPFGSGTRFGGYAGSNDPYKILEIEPNASNDEIKKSFRQLANKYHPDKVSHLGKEFRELADDRFKRIQEAYQQVKLRRGL